MPRASPSSSIESPMRTSACIIRPSGPFTRACSTAPNASFMKAIAASPSRTIKYGVSARKPSGFHLGAGAGVFGMTAVAVAMAAFLSMSLFKRARKCSRGSSTRSAATRQSGASSRSSGTRAASGRRSIASIASSSRSIRSCSGIARSHAGAQAFDAAELQLLHGALALADLRRDLADRLLLDETHLDHAALLRRQLPDQPEQPALLLDAREVGLDRRLRAG